MALCTDACQVALPGCAHCLEIQQTWAAAEIAVCGTAALQHDLHHTAGPVAL